MCMQKPTFTIFTPTYNRAHTIKRTYESLKDQTNKDFEWLIIDDGSTDNTSAIVDQFKAESIINIRYIVKENGGKHTAWNLALDCASSEFFIILDADDILVSNSIERFDYYYQKIKTLDTIAGITGLCADFNDNLLGVRYPENELVGKPLFINHKYKIWGDKCGGYKLNCVKNIKFPIFDEKFMSEGIFINRVAQEYDNLFVNDVLCKVEYQQDGLSANSLRLRQQNAKGSTLYYYEAYLHNSYGVVDKIKNLLNFLRFRFHHYGFNLRYKVRINYLKVLLYTPISYIIYLQDKWKLKK